MDLLDVFTPLNQTFKCYFFQSKIIRVIFKVVSDIMFFLCIMMVRNLACLMLHHRHIGNVNNCNSINIK